MSPVRRASRQTVVIGLLLSSLSPPVLAQTAAATTTSDIGSPVDLEPLPQAPLDGLQDTVRRQLDEKRRLLDAALSRAAQDLDPSGLVPLYGDLGRLYLLYDRPETAAPCFRNVTRLVAG